MIDVSFKLKDGRMATIYTDRSVFHYQCYLMIAGNIHTQPYNRSWDFKTEQEAIDKANSLIASYEERGTILVP